MTDIAAALALHLIRLTGPDGQHIEINPSEIVSIRTPRHEEQKGHFHERVRCLIFTGDGKFTAVIEDCDTVSRLLLQAELPEQP
jgi:hypothetical protein